MEAFDIFFEQIIQRKSTTLEKVVRIIMIICGVAAIAIMLLISFLQLFGMFSFLLLPVAFGCAVGLWYIISNTYVEYEYCITNDSFDIDKIIGRRKRLRMLTTACSDFEEFGVYDKDVAARMKNREFGGRVMAANLMDDGLFYGIVRHKKLGSVLVVIEPDERVTSALKKFLPRQVQGNVLGGFGYNRNSED